MPWLTRIMLLLMGVALALTTACMAPVNAPYDAELADLDGVTVAWDASYEGEPNIWALFRVDFYVSSSEDKVPYNNVVLEVFSGYEHVYVLPTGVINVANCPQGEGQWDTYCSDPNQTWGELTGDFNSALTPTFYRGYTDSRGVESVWLWIEDMPVTDESVGSVSITASIGVDSTTFAISAD
jgi:hypothetical protein